MYESGVAAKEVDSRLVGYLIKGANDLQMSLACRGYQTYRSDRYTLVDDRHAKFA